MFLALRMMWSRSRSAPPEQPLASAEPPTSGSGPAAPPDPTPLGQAEALWLLARDEVSPFRRDELFVQIGKLMVDAVSDELLGFCARHVGAAAEDVAQSTYITFWQILPRFEGRSSLRTFLFGIALNHCRRATRSATRESRRLDVHEDLVREEVHPERLPSVDFEHEHHERMLTLERTLAMMEPRDAWILRARLVDELSYVAILPQYVARFGAEISTQEGLRTAFFRAKKALEARLRGTR